jgi:mannose-6-phosphate isomerase-like protein (cupin superfamily)
VDDEPQDTVQLIGANVTFVPMEEGTPYSLVEWDADPGAQSPPVHVHHKTDEGFYVMAGHFGFVLDGVTTYGKPGAHVMVPMGHPHTFWNAGARPAKCLLIISPPGFEQYFRELAARLGDINSQEAALGLRQELSEQFDIEVVGPPVEPGKPSGS